VHFASDGAGVGGLGVEDGILGADGEDDRARKSRTSLKVGSSASGRWWPAEELVETTTEVYLVTDSVVILLEMM